MTHTNITSVYVNGRELPIIDGKVTYTVTPEPQDEQIEEGNVILMKHQGWSVTWHIEAPGVNVPSGPVVEGSVEHGK